MKKVKKNILALLIMGVIFIPFIENFSTGFKPFKFILIGTKNLIQDINLNPTRYKSIISIKKISKTLRRPKVVGGGVAGGLIAFSKIGDFIFKKEEEEDNL